MPGQAGETALAVPSIYPSDAENRRVWRRNDNPIIVQIATLDQGVFY